MKLCIVSTTIFGEKGYLPFDKLASKSKFDEVVFVIAGDKKSPAFDASLFENKVEYLTPEQQEVYACSESIGWNTIKRRNIAALRAMELSPDYILFIDDDNIPDEGYFDRWFDLITGQVKKEIKNLPDGNGWHNYLKTSDAPFEMVARGMPISVRKNMNTEIVDTVEITPEQIGVYQGISLGDPDIDAMTRIVYPDMISKVEEYNYAAIDVWSPMNTQNTLIAKEVFPLACVWPHCGRYDDIYASYTWQQFLFSNKKYVHFGDSINTQDRGDRNMHKDLSDEVEGYLEAEKVIEKIQSIYADDGVNYMKKLLDLDHPVIERQKEFFRGWITDLERILA